MLNNQWQSIQNYIDNMSYDIASGAPNNTGNLANSIEATIIPGEGGFEIDIQMAPYGVFQDKGVNGTETSWGSPFSFTNKKPPASAFASYASTLSGQFAIANYIYKHGIKPKNFIQPVLDRKLEGLGELIADTIWEKFFDLNSKQKDITIKVW